MTPLHKLVVDPASPPAVKARAAYYIITLGNKAIEIDDIEQRLTELERAAEEAKQSRRQAVTVAAYAKLRTACASSSNASKTV